MDQSEEDWELILDIRSRMLLHWNYRNLNEIPPELIKNGSHIREIYFKRNCLTTLVSCETINTSCLVDKAKYCLKITFIIHFIASRNRSSS